MGLIINPYNFGDADAQAFITAASITEPTQQDAIKTLVIGLKSNSIWNKMKAIYPIVGGAEINHKYNLKDPRNLDAAFRLTFSGNAYVHSSTGMKPSGNSSLADTHLNGLVDTQLNSIHLSFYSRTALLDNYPDFGIYDGTWLTFLYTRYNTQCLFTANMNLSTAEYASKVLSDGGKGFICGTRTASNITNVYENGVKGNTSNGVSTTRPNGTYKMGNVYITRAVIRECAFASIGDGLTDTDVANLYTLVQAYQTTLGRQV